MTGGMAMMRPQRVLILTDNPKQARTSRHLAEGDTTERGVASQRNGKAFDKDQRSLTRKVMRAKALGGREEPREPRQETRGL